MIIGIALKRGYEGRACMIPLLSYRGATMKGFGEVSQHYLWPYISMIRKDCKNMIPSLSHRRCMFEDDCSL